MACTLLCALAITTVGCSKEDPNAPEGEMKRITATGNILQNDLETRIAHGRYGTMEWIETDKIGVWVLNKEETYTTFEMSESGGYNKAFFSGEISCKEGDVLCAVYPNQPMKDGEIYLNLENQPGGYDTDPVPQYMCCTGTLKNNAVEFQFENLVSGMEISSFIDDYYFDSENATIKITADGLSTSATLKMTSEGLQLTKNGDGKSRQSINVGKKGKSSFFIRLFDDDLKNIEVETTDGKITYKTILPDKKLKAGTMYDFYYGKLPWVKQ